MEDVILAKKYILKHDNRGDEIVGDCYDLNKSVEYDCEEVILPLDFDVSDVT